jgi:hypothetical protein
MAAADATTETRKKVRDFLACTADGHESTGVCGVCGTLVCEDCSTTVQDIHLPDYERGGLWRVVLGLVFLAGVPVLLTAVFPRLVRVVRRQLIDQPIYLKESLVLSSVLVGMALLMTVRYRFADGSLDLFVRRSSRRTVCSECKRQKNQQRYVRYAVVAVALVFVGYGLYQSLPGLFFPPIKYSGIGVALYVLRDDLVTVVTAAIG